MKLIPASRAFATIRVEVASSAHPKFAVNLGTAGDQSVATDGIVANNRLYHDAARPSRLLLTVLERTHKGD